MEQSVIATTTLCTHPVKAMIQEIQQNIDCIHVDSHIFKRAWMHLGDQQDIQTLERQIAQQIDGVAV